MADRDSLGRFIKGGNIGHPAYGGFNTRFAKGHKDLVSKDARKKSRHKISISLTNKKLSETHKINLSKALTGRKLSDSHIKNSLRRRNKSSLEIKMEQLIKKLGLPYKFVGNGEVIIARKSPDFINSNGEKIAVEVYYRKHKQMFRNGLDEWKAERARIFNENGWQIIFLDETQVNENVVEEQLGGLKNRG